MNSAGSHTLDHVLALLFGAADGVREELYEGLARAGFGEVRPGHGCVFGHVAADGSRVTDLALATGLTKQAVGEAASDLEQLGYLERRPDPDDRRAKILYLTERGRAAQAEGFRLIAAIEKRLVRRYGRQRFEELKTMLAELDSRFAEQRRAA
jgi:DNA-binding MarR family transcriptional regulator